MELEELVKFHGYDSWTPWVSSDSQLKEKKEGDNIGLLIPVIIVYVIALTPTTEFGRNHKTDIE